MEALVGTSWIDRISSLPDPLVPLAEASLASTACACLLAPKQSIPHQSFHNLTSLAGSSLSSFLLGSSSALEVVVAAPKQIASSLRGRGGGGGGLTLGPGKRPVTAMD